MNDVFIEKKRIIPVIVMMGCFLILFYFAGYYTGAEAQVNLCNKFIQEEYHNEKSYSTTTTEDIFRPTDIVTDTPPRNTNE